MHYWYSFSQQNKDLKYVSHNNKLKVYTRLEIMRKWKMLNTPVFVKLILLAVKVI